MAAKIDEAIWVLRTTFPSAQPIFHNVYGSVIGFFTHEPESLYNNNHNGECLDFMEILSQTIRRRSAKLFVTSATITPKIV